MTIPADFARRVERGDSPQILIEADATDPSVASGAISTLGTVASQALLREQGMQAQAAASARSQLEVVVHRRYNPEGISQYNIVPGLLGVILQMTHGDDDLDGADARDRARHHGEPARHAGEAARDHAGQGPALSRRRRGAGGGRAGGGQAAVRRCRSSARCRCCSSAILVFVLALVLLGYTISTVARTQMQAMQLTFFFFLPSILLSGFMFPYRGMPGWAQMLGEIFPLTHFLRIIRAVMLKGADFPAIGGEVAALALFVAAVRRRWRCCGSAGRWTRAWQGGFVPAPCNLQQPSALSRIVNWNLGKMRKFLIGCALVAGMGAMLPSASFAQDVQIEIGRDGLRLKEACDSRYENCRNDRRGRDYARRFCTRTGLSTRPSGWVCDVLASCRQAAVRSMCAAVTGAAIGS